MTGRTFGDDLARGAKLHPERVAVLTDDGQLSYEQLDQFASSVAAGLLDKGVERGDRVAVMLPNGLSMVASIFGVIRAGAAFVPLNPTIKQEKLTSLLGHSEARILICDEQRATVAREAIGATPGAELVDDLSALRADDASRMHPTLSSDLAAIVYTSGSTGAPKGVTLTHRNMTFVADSMIEYLEMDETERVMCVLPLSFGYGLYQLLTCVRAGATLILEAGLAFPGRVVQLLDEQAVTALPGVPTVFNVLLSLRGLAAREFPRLRVLTNAGAALPSATITELRRVFPSARLYSMYGQTECQRVCYLPPSELEVRPTSVGVAIPGTRAWVEAPDGGIAGPGEVGELIVSGDHVMQGYWNDPDATATRLRPGRWPWERILATGDLFRTDEEGFLYFVGRRDDIIKSGGEKVPPREVEEVLHGAPGVREAAVVGVPDKILGEAVCAHVALDPGLDRDPSALRRYCTQHLEDYMVPRSVVFHDELPRTENGKLDRRALTDPGS
jgi:amino acid adenylation domain-containing protein